VCKQCNRELAARWFPIKRRNISGRNYQCRLGRHCYICWRIAALVSSLGINP
jgi:hypothetical protein